MSEDRIRGYIIYPLNTVKLGQGGNDMLLALIALLIVCFIAIQDKDVKRNKFSFYFVDIVMMFTLITIGCYIVYLII